MVCTFFGNRDITDNISEKIEKIILFLIEVCVVNRCDPFFVKNKVKV